MLQDDLLSMDKKLWSGGPGEYRHTLDAQCLIAFSEMAGVSSREDIAAQADAQRWRDVDVKVEGFLQPAENIAILTYRASAARASGEPYATRVSSGYVKRTDGWKMMFHQQTPLNGPGPSKGKRT
jgi:hypothetical protein